MDSETNKPLRQSKQRESFRYVDSCMVSGARSAVELVRDVLRRHWELDEVPVASTQGVSRATWKIGTGYWLSQAESERYSALAEKARFLVAFGRFLKDQSCSISVPECGRTLDDQPLVLDSGYVWGLTRHLPGAHPNAHDPRTYPKMIEGLARFHLALRDFQQTRMFEAPAGVCEKTCRLISKMGCERFVPFTSDPLEEEIVCSAAEWLTGRLASFESLPRQIVHGDFTPQNVLFGGDGRDVLSAVLDFEAVALDPVHVDIGNVCSTLLMWSNLEDVEEHIASAMTTYSQSTGTALDLGEIHTAMVARWFCHYWDWRERSAFGEFGREVEQRLCARISAVFAYVTND